MNAFVVVLLEILRNCEVLPHFRNIFLIYLLIFVVFYDDEDDIMIIEEKDALDVPDQIEFVAEEVIIEEAIEDEDYTEIVCVSPKYIDEISNLNGESLCEENYDNSESGFENGPNDKSEGKLQQVDSTSIEEEDIQTEPIYLSDSLSCFDSDSEIPALAEKLEAAEDIISLSAQQACEDDETEPLNESADDVIIVPECTDTIEIDRSDTEDESYSGALSFEMCLESDSHPSADSAKHEVNENILNSALNNSQMYATTNDADDDSSEVEKRSVRSRRDNAARKNYSCRRNYARRKAKNDTNSVNEMNSNKNENCDEEQKTLTIEYSSLEECLNDQTFKNIESSLPGTAPESNTTDGTDEESNLNLARTMRTYVRKKLSNSNPTSGENSTSKMVQESVSPMRNVKISCYGVHVGADSNSESTTIPKKRGRPRKKTAPATDEKRSNSSSGNQSPLDVPEVHSYVPKNNKNAQCFSTTDIHPEVTIEFEKEDRTIKVDTIANEVLEDDNDIKSVMKETVMEDQMRELTIVSENNEECQNISNVDYITYTEVDCHERDPTRSK